MSARERLFRLPKAELHVHLDGSLRPSTLIDLARERGVTLPAADAVTLAERMVVRDADSLEEYLERFRLTLAVMQDAEAIERIAYELAEDYAREHVGWLEVRFCPGLCTARGLEPECVLDATLAGLARARRDHGIPSAVIVTALRSLPARASCEMAELAAAYRDRGVCAFDLAGAEKGHPVRDHLDAVRIARAAGLPLTIHAGEGFGAASVREAVELGRAARLGHGTRLIEDAALLEDVRAAGIVLEVCLTSNVQTHVVASYAAHPLRRYFDAGVHVSLCTDNRLMSGVTLTDEYEKAQDALRFSWEELVEIARMGFAGAFAPPDTKAAMLADFAARASRSAPS
ncbi:MAG: adenosine deaminase [Gemmatimonadales bacterium]